MPEINTKYNYINKLQTNFNCGNGSISRSYFFTLDPSDNFINNTTHQNRIYTNSRASYYIHPFSQVSNSQSHICELDRNTSDLSCTNPNSIFNIKIPARVPIDNSSSIFKDYIQKHIQNVVGVKSSLYTDNLASLYVSDICYNNNKPYHNASDRAQIHGLQFRTGQTSLLPNYGIDIKHNSYDRYLMRKKSQYLTTERHNSSTPETPNFGNKTYKLGIVRSRTCNTCN